MKLALVRRRRILSISGLRTSPPEKVIRPKKLASSRPDGPRQYSPSESKEKGARRLSAFAAADLDAKRPVFGSKHFLRQAGKRQQRIVRRFLNALPLFSIFSM